MKNQRLILKQERWKKKFVWVVRRNGKIITWRRKKPVDRKIKIQQEINKQIKQGQVPTLSEKILSKVKIGKSKKEPDKSVYQYISKSRIHSLDKSQIMISADVYTRDRESLPFTYKTRETGYSKKGSTKEEGIYEAEAMIRRKVAEKYEIPYTQNFMILKNIEVKYISWKLK